MKHILYTPFTGLGLYGGYRGKRWLRNRIHIFKQFVIPSLEAQTEKNFTLWISWRYEDRKNPLVLGLAQWLSENTKLKFFFTYSGVCFWDDKYPDDVARSRLIDALHGASPYLAAEVGQEKEVLVTLQPSDDCYRARMVYEVQTTFAKAPQIQAFAYKKGYVMDYVGGRVAEWNPSTNPPFYTIKFPTKTLLNPLAHIEYAGIKSHEYLPEKLVTFDSSERGFLVGTHGENISTIFDHPFRGEMQKSLEIRDKFGLMNAGLLTLPISWRKKLMRRLPHRWQRKLRYIFGERFAAKIYDWLRS